MKVLILVLLLTGCEWARHSQSHVKSIGCETTCEQCTGMKTSCKINRDDEIDQHGAKTN